MTERETWSHMEKVKTCGLERIGRIHLDNQGVIHFTLEDPPTGEGCIYAWIRLSQSGKPQQVLYIGQSAQTLQCRSGRHEYEWRKSEDKISEPSRRARNATLAYLKDGYGIDIYGRVSRRIEIFKQDASLCPVEERVAIDLINPEWNGSKESILRKREKNRIIEDNE